MMGKTNNKKQITKRSANWLKFTVKAFTPQVLLGFGAASADSAEMLPAKSAESFRMSLSHCIFFRVLIVSMLLGSSAWSLLVKGTDQPNLNLVFGVIAVTFALSLLNALWLRFSKRLMVLAYVQFLFDITLSTAAMYVSGGTDSPFISLYLLVIVGAAVVLNRKGAVIVAALSGLCYMVLAGGFFPSIDGVEQSVSWQHILGVYLSLLGIALVSGYLARQLELASTVATAHAKNIKALNHHQRQLFNDLSEGIITLDLRNSITSVNRSARSILALSKLDAESLLGRNLPELLTEQGDKDTAKKLSSNLTRDASGEMLFTDPTSGQATCVRYNVCPLSDDDDNEIGRILLFNDISALKTIEERLTRHEAMTELLAAEHELQEVGDEPSNRLQMIGESQVMKQVFNLISRVASSDASVLLSGESGTGKELIAKAVHAGGPRSSHPFVAVNCGAIPENLIESELFGHKKGSFTGAIADKPGLFRQASGGTIFLDEIGELPLHLQSKLLRVLQERTIRPVGEVRSYPFSVRVVSASNRELKKEVEAGRFREDLFYRLNVVNIVLPPLRDRRQDIPLLVRHFIGRYCDPSKVLPQVSPEALELLLSYDFPGNIRELENLIERALVLGGKAILPRHLPDEIIERAQSSQTAAEGASNNGSKQETEIVLLPVDLEATLAKAEIHYLEKALEQSGGVKKQAAELLGLNFRSLRYRLKKYGLGETSSSS